LVASAAGESSYEFNLAREEKYTAEITPAGGKAVSRPFTFAGEGDPELSFAIADKNRLDTVSKRP
jgi:hypothetical protein